MACLVVCCFLLFVNTRFRRKHEERKKSRLRAPRARSTRRCRADPWGVHGVRRAHPARSRTSLGGGCGTCSRRGRRKDLRPFQPSGRTTLLPRPPGQAWGGPPKAARGAACPTTSRRVRPPAPAWRPSGDTPLPERPLSERGRPAGGPGTDDRLCASGNHVSQWTTDEDGK